MSLRARGKNRRGELPGGVSQDVARMLRIPTNLLAAQSRRPHQIERRMEANHNVDRTGTSDHVPDYDNLAIERNPKFLVNHEVWPEIRPRHMRNRRINPSDNIPPGNRKCVT